MIDTDAAIGFVVAKGDPIDRARLAHLRTGATASEEILTSVEAGQSRDGGWPAVIGGDVASIDATCFRLAELDDLGGLARPAARRALDWLASRQGSDGTWDEHPSLADVAPPWAQPGDPEARLFVTANAAFWLLVAGREARASGPLDDRPGGAYAGMAHAAAEALRSQVGYDGSLPTFLVAQWLAGAVLYRQEMYYESARIQMRLTDRMPEFTAADTAWLAASMRRVGVPAEDSLMVAALRRLAQTQRSDGGFESDDGPKFDVHTTLTAIRAVLAR
ncbi:prenyltransferase/squalene oxidase repeat-containing protein [Allocatelliglobosispora scoriae]|uniref:prenyltransferase/squalene oxidase repeat-containing protein n=1 Tax=Allocatelliglobosispora scoriae TaxID=643052 RepID=UPI00160E4C5B|nr:prenyltransferase/squalene oxidase repeat-containing protein [Allocatelliglobosispora scoriae]